MMLKQANNHVNRKKVYLMLKNTHIENTQFTYQEFRVYLVLCALGDHVCDVIMRLKGVLNTARNTQHSLKLIRQTKRSHWVRPFSNIFEAKQKVLNSFRQHNVQNIYAK